MTNEQLILAAEMVDNFRERYVTLREAAGSMVRLLQGMQSLLTTVEELAYAGTARLEMNDYERILDLEKAITSELLKHDALMAEYDVTNTAYTGVMKKQQEMFRAILDKIDEVSDSPSKRDQSGPLNEN